MSWVSLTVDVPEAKSERVQGLMHALGAAGLEVRDSSQLIMPQVRAPSKGQAIVIGWFGGRVLGEAAQAAVRSAVPRATALLEAVVERDWSTEWRSQIKSVTVGRLWVGPPWEKKTAPKNKVRIFIEPKMAFGTGDHPTTSLCLAAVDDFLAGHPGATVLDVGTGTGVLSFAAKKLGAGTAIATDNDPVCIELARECALENGIEGIDFSTRELDEVRGGFDLVLANILANTLVELAPAIAPKVKQRLVLAGVLVPQADEVKAAYLKQGLVHAGDRVEGEWIRIEFDAGKKPRPAKKPSLPAKQKTVSRSRARAQLKLARRPGKR
jgi:ribosomal protein L11 methyltransferase